MCLRVVRVWAAVQDPKPECYIAQIVDTKQTRPMLFTSIQLAVVLAATSFPLIQVRHSPDRDRNGESSPRRIPEGLEKNPADYRGPVGIGRNPRSSQIREG